MRSFVSLALALVALALTPGSAAAGTTLVLEPATDIGLPFWCDWGYDWDERCYTDDGSRLPVGGVDDKVWRSAVRFPIAQLPADGSIAAARLRLWFDGTCVAPRKTSVRCGPRGYDIDVHRILSADWLHERELEFDEEVEATAALPAGAGSRWLEWDVTTLARSWRAGSAANDGLLLKLAAFEEDFGVSGPYLPSMSYPDASVRPQLVVAYP